MPTPVLPISGRISLKDVKDAFASRHGNSLVGYRGKHRSLPATGPIKMRQFAGLTASTPTLTLGAVTGTNMAMSASGVISGTLAGVLTVDLSSALDDSVYQGACTYSVTAGTLPSGVTLGAGTGTLSINASAVTSGTVAVTVTVTNAYGNTSAVPLSFLFVNTAPTTTGTPALTGLRTTVQTLNMASYFSGTVTSYAITVDSPHSNAIISGSTLSVTPSNRGSTYSVTVTATNSGGSASQTVSITELLPAPMVSGTPPAYTGLTTTVQTRNMATYFMGTVASYATTSSPYGNVLLSGSTITITPDNRGVTYSVTVTATNSGGSASQVQSITELPAAPVASGTPTAFTGLTTTTVSQEMYYYFLGSVVSYSASSSRNNVSMSGSMLYVTPANHGATYTVTVTATNTRGSASQSVSVTELPAAPAASGSPTLSSLTTTTQTLNMAGYFMGTVTSYAIIPGTNAYGAIMSGSTLSVTPNNRGLTYYLTVTATNAGGTGYQTVTVTELLPAPTASGSPALLSSLTTTTQTLNMAVYFTSTSLTYALTGTNTYNASMSGSTLSVTPDNRGLTYTLTVTATNSGGSASKGVSVTELPAAPTTTGTPSFAGIKTTTPLDMASYFKGTVTSYSVTNPKGNASMSGSILTIVAPTSPGTTYSVSVTATNAGGSAVQVVSVNEASAAPYINNPVNFLEIYRSQGEISSRTLYIPNTGTSSTYTGYFIEMDGIFTNATSYQNNFQWVSGWPINTQGWLTASTTSNRAYNVLVFSFMTPGTYYTGGQQFGVTGKNSFGSSSEQIMRFFTQ
jgi:hypothetical protein